MILTDLSAELNIPLKDLIIFLNSKDIVLTGDSILTKEVQQLLRDNAEQINANLEIVKITPGTIEGPKVVGRIDLERLSGPKILGKIDLPIRKAPPPPKENIEKQKLFKGIIDEIENENKIKIHFIKYEKLIKDGKLITLENPDLSKWTHALKEHWPGYKFKAGEKITFSIQEIEKRGKKMLVAMPQVINKDEHTPLEKNNEKLTDSLIEKKTITKEKETIIEEINQLENKITLNHMNTNISPLQKILFGSPGTGKSYKIVDADDSYFSQLIVDGQNPDLIKTVFHPEYTYGDFMGKLMPLTNNGKVEYRYYSGHFMLALGTAYKNIVKAYMEYNEKIDELEKDFKSEKKKNKSDYTEDEKSELQLRITEVIKPIPKNVLLVIDEINRGNSAAIFGTAFQLLDRDNEGWSSYPVKISDLELQELLAVTGFYYVNLEKENEVIAKFDGKKIEKRKYDEYTQAIFEELSTRKRISLNDKNIKIPPNLSIIATMNTSDNSIYFMDSAFKRRWDWEFIDITSDEQINAQLNRRLEDGFQWNQFVDNLNAFIKKYGERIRKIEDKQIGYYFIKGDVIKHDAIKNKLMFFLWDSIFNNDKKPLKELIGLDKTLVTFGDFIKHYGSFIDAIKTKSFMKDVL